MSQIKVRLKIHLKLFFFIERTRNLINNKLCESELLAFAEKGLFMPSTKLQVSIGFPPKIGLVIERQS
jgi:hypothetical protein